MSALGLLRSGTARLSASHVSSIATPKHFPHLQGLRFYASRNVRDAYPKYEENYKRDIKTVMANPKLDEHQKYLISKRIFALMDWATSHIDCREH
jgi:hypothetical protein